MKKMRILLILIIMGGFFMIPAHFNASSKEIPDQPSNDSSLIDESSKFSIGIREGTPINFSNNILTAQGNGQDFYSLRGNKINKATYFLNGEEVLFGEIDLVFKTKITIGEGPNENWNGAGLYIGEENNNHYFLRIQKDGGIHILKFTGTADLVYKTSLVTHPLVAGDILNLVMHRTKRDVSIWLNDEIIFEEVAIPTLGKRFGVSFSAVGTATKAENFEAYFTEEVTILLNQSEETYPDLNQDYTYNTIMPEFTLDKDLTNNKIYNILGIIFIVGSSVGIVILVILKIKQKRQFVKGE